ncbi:voltage-gated chloride channel family protein [Granulicella mallensis]|uniref:H+/Cl- antiporter ClcA/PII-like signaling protein n=1 Tax=Granulicella mallensis TaxID=940614 RepID=A0A7W7ZRT5_9BACT|nr:voltage-gated chloride channel family protein [Granulicella mallensis]MBB5064574.1 H+/Cl- antiporter ClcA/PII-like signaling protein [Granulicella mallensis]
MSETSRHRYLSEQLRLLLDLARWIPISAIVGILAGSASALLLVSLNFATEVRESHKWIILLLAPVGVLVGLMYHYLGRSVEAGNNLLLEEIHDPKSVIPFRMTPLILLGTFLTHLFGGSAGREGTALQTGASLADQLTRPLRLASRDRRILLMAGISAGFGSVFGTPLAGALFGIEVLAIGRLSYEALAPCMIAAFIGDLVTHAWGVRHTLYRVTTVPEINIKGILAAIAAGVAFGLVGMAFAKVTHAIAHFVRRHIAFAPLRPAAGGVLVTAAVFALGTTKYIGLGIPTIVASFDHKLPIYDWAAKFLFTAVTLGSGFKGGEVTPLFYIGSTLGNALSGILPLPPSLLAGMGFVAVFAGAANTPIASTLMAVELFGAEAGAYAGIACIISYLFSGHSSIYQSQRVGKSKHLSMNLDEGMSLAVITKMRNEANDEDEADLLESINDFGYVQGSDMEHLSVLRLYFSASEMHSSGSWWKRLAPQSLGGYLLRQAKEHGIEQALLHRVIGGYLKNEDLVMDTGEIPPARLPQCLELVGEEEDLQAFLKHNRDRLTKVRTVFLRGEEARIEAAIERGELEQALDMEHDEGFNKPNKEV